MKILCFISIGISVLFFGCQSQKTNDDINSIEAKYLVSTKPVEEDSLGCVAISNDLLINYLDSLDVILGEGYIIKPSDSKEYYLYKNNTSKTWLSGVVKGDSVLFGAINKGGKVVKLLIPEALLSESIGNVSIK